jgi:uncharacterized membrane protein YphA (DoxX/SURF4 family)
MKFIAHFARILVGIEFIFSGFVKVVDPYGTGLKLQEYFEVFAQDLPIAKGFFEALAHQSQSISLIFCASELILGVALLVNYRMKITSWLVLLLMSFFTFLTFYSAYFNKVTDCGCFGDFLKLKPWHSFYKDVISLAIIVLFFSYRKKFKAIKFSGIATLLAVVFAFGIGLFGLRYLPILDFLPYAIGKSIPEQMKPTGVKPIFNYVFLDKKNNTEIESKEYLMDTLQYKYVSSSILNEEATKPKITDYAISDTSGNDFTQESFSNKKLLITFKKVEGIDKKQSNELRNLVSVGNKLEIKSMLLTSMIFEEFDDFQKKNKLDAPYYSIDEKVLKTIARTNPCAILLENGIVKGKWSIHNLPSESELKDIIKK